MMIFLLIAALLAQTVRHLDYISFRGRKSLNGKSISFYNIPFAAAPVGSLRFRRPQPPVNMSSWGIQDKTKAGPSCIVDTRFLINFLAHPSEDCLQVNVYIPSEAKAGDNLPVLVYVYGGAFTDGYNSFPYGRGARNIINQGHKAIIVTMNYRMGAFGFLPSADLEKQGALNLGLHDIAESFKWVRKYIYQFGGNPRQVTAFGLSAGSISIASLMLARNGTMDLFDRASLQSGSIIPIVDKASSGQFIVDEVKNRLGCLSEPGIECIVKADPYKLLKAAVDTNAAMDSPLTSIYGPVYDGDLIQRPNLESLRLGLYRKIPVLINTNQDEGRYFTTQYMKTEDYANKWKKRLFGFMNLTDVQGLDRIYPRDDSPLPFNNYSQLLTDFYFQCPGRNLAKSLLRDGVPVYKTMFRHQLGLLSLPFFPKLGVCHGSDIPFWFQFHALMLPWSEERKLSRIMIQGLIDFSSCPDIHQCRLGGTEGSLPWPRYNSTAAGARVDLVTPVTRFVPVADTQFDFRCDYYNQVIQAKGDDIHGQYPPIKLASDEFKPGPVDSLLRPYAQLLSATDF